MNSQPVVLRNILTPATKLSPIDQPVRANNATLRDPPGPQKQRGRDGHSIVADARFVDLAQGDYRVKEESPAPALDFVNFPMNGFGVQRPALKALARTPVLHDQKPYAPRLK